MVLLRRSAGTSSATGSAGDGAADTVIANAGNGTIPTPITQDELEDLMRDYGIVD